MIQMFTRSIRASTRYMITAPLRNKKFLYFQPIMRFSTEKKEDEKLSDIKKQGEQFYNTQVQDIVELQRAEDFAAVFSNIQIPTIVNFYATWSIASKAMTPRLEKRVKDSKGKLKLVHINIDIHGQIANHFKVKDVPTIFLVYMGRSIDSFTGELSDQYLDKFLEVLNKISKLDNAEVEVVKNLQEAQLAIRSQNYEVAQSILTKMKTTGVKQQFAYVKNIFLAYIYSVLAKPSQLKAIVQILKTKEQFYTSKPQFKGLYEDLLKKAAEIQAAQEENDEFGQWKKKLAEQPQNLQLKYDASAFYLQNELHEEALENLIDICKINKEWEDKKANKKILQVFKNLGNSSPITQKYRKIFQRALH